MRLAIETIRLPTKRPFCWRAVRILGVLFIVGKLANIPLLLVSRPSMEPLSTWVIGGSLGFVVIGISLYLAGRIGIGLPLLEGLLGKEGFLQWRRSVFSLALMISIAASLPFLLVNLNVDPERYPALWKWLLSSMDAGVGEEIFYRFFLMTLIAWLGSLVWQDGDGRPTRTVFWIAIFLAGLIFGWGHVDDAVFDHGINFAIARLMIFNSLLGITFGWLYWKQGLESAILAHFMVDVVGFVVVVPVYLSLFA